jgi:predicted PurR-regulated permease PerM
MAERAKQIEQVISLSIIALLIIGSIVLVLPFLPAILWAMVFAVTIWPFFIKVEKALGGRTTLAAVVPTLLLALIFFLPLVYVGSKLVSQASIAFDYAQGLMEKGLGPAPLWFKSLPLVSERVEGIWRDIGHDTPAWPGKRGAIFFSWPGPPCARWFMGSSALRSSRESWRPSASGYRGSPTPFS